MSCYWDEKFLRHLVTNDVKTVFEVGARYGDESKKLKTVFPNSVCFSFECNPNTIDICRQKLSHVEGITFCGFGLGDQEGKVPFYSYMRKNDGASSFLKRTDFESTQEQTGFIDVKRLEDVVKSRGIPSIDLLCMDVQGYELNVLKGAGEFIKNIKHIIMEEPNPIRNPRFLPAGRYSKYINAPSPQEITQFMTKHNFVEIERIKENMIEDNVMYKRVQSCTTGT